jgi:hypothetical protein
MLRPVDRFEVGLKTRPRHRQRGNNIADTDPVGGVGLDHLRALATSRSSVARTSVERRTLTPVGVIMKCCCCGVSPAIIRLAAVIQHQDLNFSRAISRDVQALGSLTSEQVVDSRRAICNLPPALCQPPVQNAVLPFDRNLMSGVASYVQESRNFNIYIEENPVSSQKLPYLKSWNGDAILAGFDDPGVAAAVSHSGVPVVGFGCGWQSRSLTVPCFYSQRSICGGGHGGRPPS